MVSFQSQLLCSCTLSRKSLVLLPAVTVFPPMQPGPSSYQKISGRIYIAYEMHLIKAYCVYTFLTACLQEHYYSLGSLHHLNLMVSWKPVLAVP